MHDQLHQTARHALLCAAVAVCLAHLANCTTCSPIKWHLISNSCINNSDASAVKMLHTSGMEQCIIAAHRVIGHLVASFNANTSQCSVFHYQSVCHLIHAANATPNNNNHCTVYARLPVNNITALHEMQMRHKVRAAWVFGASGQENASLVCAKWPVQWQTQNVLFGEEGAVFDGSSSGMTLRRSDFGNFSTGFTWLIRLKRQPRHQTLIEHFDCDTSTVGAHFWENLKRDLVIRTYREFTPNTFITSATILPTDVNEFINIGITAVPNAASYTFFYNGAFVTLPHSQNDTESFGTGQPKYECFWLGLRPGSSAYALQGTVRAVAIANASMTEQEINSLFDLMLLG